MRTFYTEEKTMRFKTFLGLLSMDLEKVGWYVSRYEHIIESGKYHLQCQKIVTKYCYTNAEPLKKIITYDLLIDELSLFRMPVKDLITNCIIELGLEDVKA